MSTPHTSPKVGRVAGAAAEHARLTVVPRRRTRAPRIPFVVLVSMILLGGVVGLLLFNTSMQQASFAATALESQASSLSAREQQLRMELEELRDPQTLAVHARRIGMVPAPPPCFLHLGSGRVEGTCAPATPEADLNIAPRPPGRPAVLDPAPKPAPKPDRGRQGDAPRRADRDGGRGADRTEVPSNVRNQWAPQPR